jgi:hypothetical protein
LIDIDMPMPSQLRIAKRRNARARSEPRPIAEQTASILIYDLHIPRNYTAMTLPWVGLRYPELRHARLAGNQVQFTHYTGRTQALAINWACVGFGFRPYFLCTCGRQVTRLYIRYGTLACRQCSGLLYASQVCSRQMRPQLQATRIRHFFDSTSEVGKPFPRKPKTTMRFKTYNRLKVRALALEAKIKRKGEHLRKRFSTRTLWPRGNYNTRRIALSIG